MARRLHRIVSWVLHSALASAVKWTGPSSTAQRRHSHITRASIATEAPSLATRTTHIDSPSTYEPPHICGYVDFDLHNSYTCAFSNTCLWNSHLKIVGCGNPTSINYITSCVPYRDLEYCDGDCLANPSIIRCGSDLPHCITPRVGPSGSYAILNCHSTHHHTPYNIHMAYHGQTTTGHLPRWLGEDGNITYGTHIPHIVIKTIETGGLTFEAMQTLYSTFHPVGVTFTKPIVGSATAEKGNMAQETQSCALDESKFDAGESAVYSQQQKQKEIVAGSVIGSFMVLVIVVFAAGVLVAWRMKVKREQRGKGGKGDYGVELRDVESGEEVREEERRMP